MFESATNSLGEEREVVRCHACLLNQFMTRNEHCRKCRAWIGSGPAPIIAQPVPVQPLAKISTGRFMPAQQTRLDLAVLVLRHRLNLSQRQFAKKSGLLRTYISKVENRGIDPTLKLLNRIAAGLDVTPRQLIEFATV